MNLDKKERKGLSRADFFDPVQQNFHTSPQKISACNYLEDNYKSNRLPVYESRDSSID